MLLNSYFLTLLTAHPKSHNFTFPYTKTSLYHDEHNILGFDIAMQYLVLMHAPDCLEEVLGDEGCCLLGEVLMLGDDVVELPVAS